MADNVRTMYECYSLFNFRDMKPSIEYLLFLGFYTPNFYGPDIAISECLGFGRRNGMSWRRKEIWHENFSKSLKNIVTHP